MKECTCIPRRPSSSRGTALGSYFWITTYFLWERARGKPLSMRWGCEIINEHIVLHSLCTCIQFLHIRYSQKELDCWIYHLPFLFGNWTMQLTQIIAAGVTGLLFLLPSGMERNTCIFLVPLIRKIVLISSHSPGRILYPELREWFRKDWVLKDQMPKWNNLLLSR